MAKTFLNKLVPNSSNSPVAAPRTVYVSGIVITVSSAEDEVRKAQLLEELALQVKQSELEALCRLMKDPNKRSFAMKFA